MKKFSLKEHCVVAGGVNGLNINSNILVSVYSKMDETTPSQHKNKILRMVRDIQRAAKDNNIEIDISFMK